MSNQFFVNKASAIEKNILLEINLNDKIRLDVLLHTVYNRFRIEYNIVNAELEYINGNNFGTVQLLLKANDDSLFDLEAYLQNYKLVSSKIEEQQKREAS